MVGSDRREFQRLSLAKPILGLLDGQNALILDVGVGGAFIEHYGMSLPGQRHKLLFKWKGEDVEFIAEVARSNVVRTSGPMSVSQSGLRFVQAIGKSENRLQDMMATFVGKILAAQKANAMATDPGDTTLQELGGARRSRARGYITYRLLKNGAWIVQPSSSPVQPQDGFTVGAFEDEEELESLCRTYETADEEGRGLIRLVAELKRHKEAGGLPFADPDQEERLLRALDDANAGPLSREGVRRLFGEILALTKRETS